MLQPSTYLETVSAGTYKHGRRVSDICSTVGLGALPYRVGRQCYCPVRISRRTQQLALVLGWALNLTDSTAILSGLALNLTDLYAIGAIRYRLISPDDLRNTVGFGATPYGLIFVWRYTVRTRIHISRQS